MQCVLATSNEHKREEIAGIFARLGITEVVFGSLRDHPEIPAPVEDGTTFAANARIKALQVSAITGGWALADDSGLVVDALGGRPGIHSARYGGEGSTDAEKMSLLLSELTQVPDGGRTARFVCHMVLAHGAAVYAESSGACEGVIAQAPRGNHGFGYDPIVYLPDQGCTVAELTAEGKNSVSHRAQAADGLRDAFAEVRARGEG